MRFRCYHYSPVCVGPIGRPAVKITAPLTPFQQVGVDEDVSSHQTDGIPPLSPSRDQPGSPSYRHRRRTNSVEPSKIPINSTHEWKCHSVDYANLPRGWTALKIITQLPLGRGTTY